MDNLLFCLFFIVLPVVLGGVIGWAVGMICVGALGRASFLGRSRLRGLLSSLLSALLSGAAGLLVTGGIAYVLDSVIGGSISGPAAALGFALLLSVVSLSAAISGAIFGARRDRSTSRQQHCGWEE